MYALLTTACVRIRSRYPYLHSHVLHTYKSVRLWSGLRSSAVESMQLQSRLGEWVQHCPLSSAVPEHTQYSVYAHSS